MYSDLHVFSLFLFLFCYPNRLVEGFFCGHEVYMLDGWRVGSDLTRPDLRNSLMHFDHWIALRTTLQRSKEPSSPSESAAPFKTLQVWLPKASPFEDTLSCQESEKHLCYSGSMSFNIHFASAYRGERRSPWLEQLRLAAQRAAG